MPVYSLANPYGLVVLKSSIFNLNKISFKHLKNTLSIRNICVTLIIGILTLALKFYFNLNKDTIIGLFTAIAILKPLVAIFKDILDAAWPIGVVYADSDSENGSESDTDSVDSQFRVGEWLLIFNEVRERYPNRILNINGIRAIRVLSDITTELEESNAEHNRRYNDYQRNFKIVSQLERRLLNQPNQNTILDLLNKHRARSNAFEHNLSVAQVRMEDLEEKFKRKVDSVVLKIDNGQYRA